MKQNTVPGSVVGALGPTNRKARGEEPKVVQRGGATGAEIHHTGKTT